MKRFTVCLASLIVAMPYALGRPVTYQDLQSTPWCHGTETRGWVEHFDSVGLAKANFGVASGKYIEKPLGTAPTGSYQLAEGGTILYEFNKLRFKVDIQDSPRRLTMIADDGNFEKGRTYAAVPCKANGEPTEGPMPSFWDVNPRPATVAPEVARPH